MFQDDVSCDKSVDGKIRRTAPMDVEKVQSTIKAIVRDWSGEGADERKMSYEPILDQLDKVFEGKKKQNIKVSYDIAIILKKIILFTFPTNF